MRQEASLKVTSAGEPAPSDAGSAAAAQTETPERLIRRHEAPTCRAPQVGRQRRRRPPPRRAHSVEQCPRRHRRATGRGRTCHRPGARSRKGRLGPWGTAGVARAGSPAFGWGVSAGRVRGWHDRRFPVGGPSCLVGGAAAIHHVPPDLCAASSHHSAPRLLQLSRRSPCQRRPGWAAMSRKPRHREGIDAVRVESLSVGRAEAVWEKSVSTVRPAGRESCHPTRRDGSGEARPCSRSRDS